jgi:radical SAM protein with 4Fe4S-binding SPASM domain
MFHQERVLEWKNGHHIYPVYIEMSPTSLCNYKCSFCALDFIKRGKSICLDSAKKSIDEMAKLGVKSIMFAGEGEPLLNPAFIGMSFYAKTQGIDIALTTNGSMMSEDVSYELLPIMSWIKVSLNSIVPSTFSKMSGLDLMAGKVVLAYVVANIHKAVTIRNKLKHSCSIGVQMLALEDNMNDIEFTAKIMKELGVDYFVIKQYSKHPASVNNLSDKYYGEIYKHAVHVSSSLSDNNFKVVVRDKVSERSYDICHALPFWSYVASDGNVWACSAHMPDERFIMGNIYKQEMKDIWSKINYERVQSSIDINQCRIGCRMDKCNQYLHEIVHPSKHVNFV